jgi:hypothetical protein
MKYYAGIGSRITPILIQDKMKELGYLLAKQDYILRSGGAPGADSAFEEGCILANGEKEIYLPWKGFNKNLSPLYDISEDAHQLAKKFHPAWNRLKVPAKLLMARNGYQVLGKNLDTPVEFLVCYTSDGCDSHKSRTSDTGGTGQAISIANHFDIPIYNLQSEMDETILINYLESSYEKRT